MIRAVIDQAAFEQLVAGKEVALTGVSDGGHPRDVHLILCDIGFNAMFRALMKAAGTEHPVVKALRGTLETEPHAPTCPSASPADAIERHVALPRPPECTRRRLKPFIDACRCDWCVRFNALIQEAMSRSTPQLTIDSHSPVEHAIYHESLYIGTHYVTDGIVLSNSEGNTIPVEVIEAVAAKMRELNASQA